MRSALLDLRMALERGQKIPNIDKLNREVEIKDKELNRLIKRVRLLEKGGNELS